MCVPCCVFREGRFCAHSRVTFHVLLFLRQNGIYVRMRTGDDVHADDFAFDGFDRLGAGIYRGFDSSDVADDDGRDECVADLRHGAGEFDVRGFEHGVRALYESDEAARFNESDCLMWHNVTI
jgi:hypothetical protein